MLTLAKVISISIASIAIMFILTKIMGNKQISELTLFDYINGITIGSIAAEMATCELNEFIKPLIAMITYGTVVTLISILVNKSVKARRIFSGKSLIVYDNGKFHKKNLMKAKLDLNELLVQCRVNGYFNFSDIQTVVFESNGKLTVLPKSGSRPLTPDDMSIKVNDASILTTVILDGNIMKENLKNTGNDEKWLNKQLDSLGYSSAKKVFLGLIDGSNKLYVYSSDNKNIKNDIFQ